MGRKRAKKRKRLFLYVACFLMAVLGSHGCVSLPIQNINFPANVEAERSLMQAKALMDKKDFSAALKKTAEVLTQFPKTHANIALYHMALIYAYPENPEMDYVKSLESLHLIMQSSNLEENDKKDEIITLKTVLEAIINKDSKISKLQENVTLLEEKTSTLEKQKKPLQEEVGNLQEEVVNLKDQLKRLKEIDIGIEEKKREVLPK